MLYVFIERNLAAENLSGKKMLAANSSLKNFKFVITKLQSEQKIASLSAKWARNRKNRNAETDWWVRNIFCRNFLIWWLLLGKFVLIISCSCSDRFRTPENAKGANKQFDSHLFKQIHFNQMKKVTEHTVKSVDATWKVLLNRMVLTSRFTTMNLCSHSELLIQKIQTRTDTTKIHCFENGG